MLQIANMTGTFSSLRLRAACPENKPVLNDDLMDLMEKEKKYIQMEISMLETLKMV